MMTLHIIASLIAGFLAAVLVGCVLYDAEYRRAATLCWIMSIVFAVNMITLL